MFLVVDAKENKLVVALYAGSDKQLCMSFRFLEGKEVQELTVQSTGISVLETFKGMNLHKALNYIAIQLIDMGVTRFDDIVYFVPQGGKHSKPRIISPAVSKEIFDSYQNTWSQMAHAVFSRFFSTKKHVAIFDSAAFVALPRVVMSYALPPEYADVQKRGVGGLYHDFLFEKSRESDICASKVVTCVMDENISVSAYGEGKCIDTSGSLIGRHNSGPLAPAAFAELVRVHNLSFHKTLNLLENIAGITAICPHSDNINKLLELTEPSIGHAQATLTIEMIKYVLQKAIAGAAANLGGVDTLVFAGEFAIPRLLAVILKDMEWLGVNVKENNLEQNSIISTPKSSVTVVRVEYDEIAAIASCFLKHI